MRPSILFLLAILLCNCAGRQNPSVNGPESEASSEVTPETTAETSTETTPEGDESSQVSQDTSSEPVEVNEEVDLSRPLSNCPIDPSALGFLEPVRWTPDKSDSRWGTGVTQISEVQSSQMVPIEVCGVNGQLTWLTNLTCPDGSRPYSSFRHAHSSRVGNTGPGGRCGTTVDLYRATCPNQSYEVYMDMYHCAQGENFR